MRRRQLTFINKTRPLEICLGVLSDSLGLNCVKDGRGILGPDLRELQKKYPCL